MSFKCAMLVAFSTFAPCIKSVSFNKHFRLLRDSPFESYVQTSQDELHFTTHVVDLNAHISVGFEPNVAGRYADYVS